MSKIITLLTDFGIRDGFVAAMKAVILNINPRVRIVDISHEVPPQDVNYANFILYSCYRYFPKRTIHLCVVDPGVGTKRRILCVQTKGYYFIVPDNGLLSLTLTEEKVKKIVNLTNRKYFLKPISATFHGRDIFASTAAHLSRGLKMEELGGRVPNLYTPKITTPTICRKDTLGGEIIHIDRFGNLVTNITDKVFRDFTEDMLRIKKKNSHLKECIKIGKYRITKINKSYSQSERKELLAIFGSLGLLEISVNFGNAHQVLKAKRGDKVKIILT